MIKQFGGKMKDSVGIPEEQLRKAAQDGRLQDQHRHRRPSRHDRHGPSGLRRIARKSLDLEYLGPARTALIEMYKRKNREVLGSAGRYGQEF